jgi:hypothetical protein
MWILKKGQPDFRVTSGPMKGRRFVRGVRYAEIPDKEAHRFNEVAVARAQNPRQSSKKRKTERVVQALIMAPAGPEEA